MASPLISLVVALVVCAVTAHVDANKCSPGWATCTKGRTCRTNLWSDLRNCGQCGTKCPCGPHATSICNNGQCSFECDAKNGWSDCDGNPHNGCEVNTQCDKKNCGRCGVGCEAPPNFVASCAKGVCKKECRSGYKQCGDSCVRVAADVNNCGGCGTVCPGDANGRASCVGGICGLDCKSGFTKCDGKCSKLSSDVQNCGACATLCRGIANGTATCVGGTCGVQCTPGFVKCENSWSTYTIDEFILNPEGCKNTTGDVWNCGGCGNVCGGSRDGTAVCNDGHCGQDCEKGWSKCGGSCHNLNEDPWNCGSCGTVCSNDNGLTDVCILGTCAVDRCSRWLATCDSVTVDLSSDRFNCGGCGARCFNELKFGNCICSECYI